MSGMVERVAKAMAAGEGDSVMDHWRDRASIAIEAMREPTEAMIESGRITLGAGQGMTGASDAKWVWLEMIDTALTEGKLK